MEISGKIISVLPLQSGIGKSGTEWKKQEYVLETQEQYPKKVCFVVWGDKIQEFGIDIGQDLDISINIDAREYQGKWFNEIRSWRVVQRNIQEYKAKDIPNEEFPPKQGVKDDLPF